MVYREKCPTASSIGHRARRRAIASLTNSGRKAFDSISMKIASTRSGPTCSSRAAQNSQFWGLGWNSPAPTATHSCNCFHSKSIGQSNFARSTLKEYDEVYEKGTVAADRPQALGVVQEE